MNVWMCVCVAQVKDVPRPGNYTVNLLHYEDAAGIAAAVSYLYASRVGVLASRHVVCGQTVSTQGLKCSSALHATRYVALTKQVCYPWE